MPNVIDTNDEKHWRLGELEHACYPNSNIQQRQRWPKERICAGGDDSDAIFPRLNALAAVLISTNHEAIHFVYGQLCNVTKKIQQPQLDLTIWLLHPHSKLFPSIAKVYIVCSVKIRIKLNWLPSKAYECRQIWLTHTKSYVLFVFGNNKMAAGITQRALCYLAVVTIFVLL